MGTGRLRGPQWRLCGDSRGEGLMRIEKTLPARPSAAVCVAEFFDGLARANRRILLIARYTGVESLVLSVHPLERIPRLPSPLNRALADRQAMNKPRCLNLAAGELHPDGEAAHERHSRRPERGPAEASIARDLSEGSVGLPGGAKGGHSYHSSQDRRSGAAFRDHFPGVPEGRIGERDNHFSRVPVSGWPLSP